MTCFIAGGIGVEEGIPNPNFRGGKGHWQNWELGAWCYGYADR